jgi:peroxiredoxin Q/BCP
MPDFRIGDSMPDSTLRGPSGDVKIRDRIGGKALVVYFYPADETYGCTIEACGFRDQYQAFTDAGAEVIGISRDDAAKHEKFKANHRLPFTLLTDPQGKVADAWGVKGRLGLAGRVTFVFDKTGKLAHKFDSMIRFNKHIDEALRVVRDLAKAA